MNVPLQHIVRRRAYVRLFRMKAPRQLNCEVMYAKEPPHRHFACLPNGCMINLNKSNVSVAALFLSLCVCVALSFDGAQSY